MHSGTNDIFAVPALTLILLCAACNQGRISRLLSSKPLFYLGAISYSIYLGHWFVLVIVKQCWWTVFHRRFEDAFSSAGGAIACLVCLGAAIGLASLTYAFVEAPCRRRLKESSFAAKYIFDSPRSREAATAVSS